ncbi:MAG: DUF1080 domain-containing protein [Balneolales bacterium]
MIKYILLFLLPVVMMPAVTPAQTTFAGSEVIGKWNLTIQTDQGESPAWIEIKGSGLSTIIGYYVGSGGSARPISEIKYSEEKQLYSFSIPPQWEPLDSDLEFEFELNNDGLAGTTQKGGEILHWTGVRAPDLTRSETPVWGDPVNLLDESMSKWNTAENNQFQMEGDVMVNKEGGGNLVSKEEYDDFNIQLEYRLPEGSNSGVYLRGRYEVQIIDDYGLKTNNVLNSSIYGFIAPNANVSKKANEWQTLEVTLIGRMVTVVSNGVEVITNRPIPGPTGGAIDNDEENPGPIKIQGDHGPVEFRNMIITPSLN